MSKTPLYKIVFFNRGKVYELFADEVHSSDMMGFTTVRGLNFPQSDSPVIDPAEEKLRDEFGDVDALHLPMHSVVRIEEVPHRGIARIRERDSGENVMLFPGGGQT